EEAVLKYQHDHALDQDGIAGVDTLTALWECKPLKRK
ncbi:MAG: peptidoglycan-binding protein, partial [Clostridiales bacterium]|nr:peptidoglycan-binding protein [Clostridiales bacterium]